MVALAHSQSTEEDSPMVPQRGYVQIGWKIVTLLSVIITAFIPALFLFGYLLFLTEAVLTPGMDFFVRADHSSTDLSIVLCLTLASAMALRMVNEHGLLVLFLLMAAVQGVSYLLTRRYLPMMCVTEGGGTYTALLTAPWRPDPSARVVTWEEFNS